MKGTAETRPVDIEELKPLAEYLMYQCVRMDRSAVKMTFAKLLTNQPAWNVNSVIRGMEHLRDVATRRSGIRWIGFNQRSNGNASVSTS